jgi:hypothetical protein
MSLHHIATQLAAKGRDEDKMLVHMTPREVAGLQQIAMAHGGSLTINPETGLPEAGFLKSILPMLAGAVATFFTGGAAAPWMAALAGGVTGAATGDKNQSLLMRMGMGALGGWGGGSLAAGLAKAGAGAATNVAAKTAAEQGVKTAAGNVAGNVATKTAGEVAGTVAKNAVGAGAKTVAGETAKTLGSGVLSNTPTGLAAVKAAGTGLTKLGTEAGRSAVASGMFGQMPKAGLAAAALPVMMDASTVKPIKGSKEPVPEYQMYSYNPGTVNPNFGQPGEPYFLNQSYSAPRITNQNPYAPTYSSYDKKGKGVGAPGLSPLEQYMMDMQGQQQPPIAAAEGGALNDYIAGMNEGKATSDPVGMNLNDYLANMNQQRSMAASPMEYKPPNMGSNGRGGYGSLGSYTYGLGGLGPMGGSFEGGGGGSARPWDSSFMPSRFAAGGGVESIGGYSDGGRLLRGPGDGVSDDIPATIHRDDGSKQEARLADGEFVFPARIVSEIGNGSTEAGAKKLYAVMDRIQKDRARTMKDVAADTNAIRHVESLA